MYVFLFFTLLTHCCGEISRYGFRVQNITTRFVCVTSNQRQLINILLGKNQIVATRNTTILFVRFSHTSLVSSKVVITYSITITLRPIPSLLGQEIFLFESLEVEKKKTLNILNVQTSPNRDVTSVRGFK